ncbi:MAG: thioesterase family protein [Bdellovibrionota bacterium]
MKTHARFRDADPVGILFFARAYELAHDAYEDFVRSLGFTYREWFENETWGVPIRKSECEHLRPIKPGDEISVSVKIENLGESSFTTSYSIASAGQPASEVKLTHVFMDVKTKKKMAIPSNVRSRLEAHQR